MTSWGGGRQRRLWSLDLLLGERGECRKTRSEGEHSQMLKHLRELIRPRKGGET